MSTTDRSPENTSARDPLLHLVGMLGGGVERYIEEMESAGQAQLVNSTKLPADMQGQREQFEALGFAFGVENDLFIDADLPKGWRKEGSDHAMWSYIVDERGLRRVGIFYKAAFYDRHAHMYLQDVGYGQVTEYFYGDDDHPPIRWEILTDDEKASAAKALARMGHDIEEYPSVYGKYSDLLAKALATIPGVGAS